MLSLQWVPSDVKSFVAFRCPDTSYLLVPDAASFPWFGYPSAEFLGDVRAESFEHEVALRIENAIVRWNFALISKDEFHFSWPQAQDRTRNESSEPIVGGAVAAPCRLNETRRSLSKRKRARRAADVNA
jgi:hypothetical protein